MFQIPHEFLWEECISLNIILKEPGYYGVGMAFLPKGKVENAHCRSIIEKASQHLGFNFLGFREVPVCSIGIGITALSVEPAIVQFFIERPSEIKNAADFERKLFVLRRLIVQEIKKTSRATQEQFYVSSLSCETIVYKGQLTTAQVRSYYPDLSDNRVVSAFGLVHSRFSTNTFPSW